MNKPCNGCRNAKVGFMKSRLYHYCNDCIRQSRCNEYAGYLAWLESKRKYTYGSEIATLEALLSETMVWIFGRAQHIEVVKSLQLRTVLMCLKGGGVRYAVRK